MPILDYGTALRGAPNPLANSLGTAGQMQGLMQNAQALQQNRMVMEQQQNAIAQQAEEKKRRELALQEGADLMLGKDFQAQAQFMLKNPDVAQQFIGAMNFMNNAQISDRINFNKSVIAGAGDPILALQKRIQEVKARGGDTTNLEDTLALRDPQAIKDTLQAELSFLDPQAEPMTEYQRKYLEMKEAEQELARIKADRDAERNDLNKKKLDIEIQEKEEKLNETKRKIEEQDIKLDAETQAIQSEGQAVLDLIDSIESHEGFGSAVGMKGASTLFGLTQPIAGTPAADVQAMIDTLEAKGFLTAIGNFKSKGGSGSLSDNEGKKLAASISSLSTSQSEEGFKRSLNEIRKLVKQGMQTAQTKQEKREGKPDWYINSTEEQKIIIDDLKTAGVQDDEIMQLLGVK